MKKRMRSLWIYLLVISLVAIVIVGCGNSSAPGGNDSSDPIVLKLSHNMGEESNSGKAYAFFAKAVEEESKGRVKVDIYPASSLVAADEAFDAVRNGTVDFTHFMVAYFSPTMTDLTPLEIPGAYPGNKYRDLDRVTRPILEEIFAEYDMKFIAPLDQSSETFTSRQRIIKQPSDFDGMKVRVAGKWHAEAVELWGGAPVTISLGDVPAALERGTVDTVYVGWVVSGPFRLYESGKYVTFLDLQAGYGGLVMNLGAWNKLSKENQEAVNRAIERFLTYSNELSTEEKGMWKEKMGEEGATVYELSAEELKPFIDVAPTLLEKVEKIVGPKGLELMEALESLRK